MDCMFCDEKILKKEEVMRNGTCVFLSNQEVVDMFNLLKEVRKYLDEKYKPSGYTLGWNIGKVSGQIEPFHAHLHIMPRYDDEPLAKKGVRYFLKQKNNSRIKE